MYLLFTILFTSGCHADGPLPWWMRDDAERMQSFCPERDVLSIDSQRFRTLDACEAEARLRWHQTGYRAASRCVRSR